MARYTDPVCRLCRSEGIKLFLKGDKCLTKCTLDRRNSRPGQHGAGRKRTGSNYSVQLREKQKIRRYYGVFERQFRRHFDAAARRAGQTNENLLQILEMRLDNIVYRLGFADSHAQARQLVNHGHFIVNNRRTDIPSFIVKSGDTISVYESSKDNEYFKARALILQQKSPPSWLLLNNATLSGTVQALPSVSDTSMTFDAQKVVEFYQR